MTQVYCDARFGRLATGEASRLVFVLSALLNAISVSAFEERVDALERILTEQEPSDADEQRLADADQPEGAE